ncbi:MAG: hypothetical protein GC164_06010 [Phycisphaera sp.]|nr:hypothetical protein [Phycisphaera sp.]
MSALTKVFVVLVCVMSILLVALVVPFVANQQNYKEMYNTELSRRKVAETATAVATQQVQSLQQVESARNAELRAQVTALNNQITTLTADLTSTQAQLKDAQATVTAAKADVARLAAANQQIAKVHEATTDELKKRRDDDVDQKSRIVEQVERINELTSQTELLQRAVRRLQEENVTLTEKLANVQAELQKVPAEYRNASATGDQAITPAVPLFGQVTGVQDMGGQTFVKINIGSSDGVAKNMRFLIHRGDQYLGDMVVTLVDERAAAGLIKLTPKGAVPIAAGDQVQTGSQL